MISYICRVFFHDGILWSINNETWIWKNSAGSTRLKPQYTKLNIKNTNSADVRCQHKSEIISRT